MNGIARNHARCSELQKIENNTMYRIKLTI